MSTTLSEPQRRPRKALPSPSVKPRGRLLRAAAFGLGGVLLFGLILELLVTLALGPQVRFPRHVVDGGFGVRINEPGAVYRHSSPDVDVEFRINARGLRADRDYAYAKPPGKKRIVAIGDSFTAGYEVAVDECFASVLERELLDRGHDVEVLNAGVSGFGNAEACVYLENELFKYEPDIVLLSFFNNDLVDNVRSNLFVLEGDTLRAAADSYVPLGGMGDFLNTNPVFNALSERSNAFALLKERVTKLLKHEAVADNERNMQVDTDASESGILDERRNYQRRLAAGILGRILERCHERDIPFVVQSIPLLRPQLSGADGVSRSGRFGVLLDVFPREVIDIEQPGFHFLAAAEFLEPQLDKEPLYHLRSHMHWTPFSNRLSGENLAELIEGAGLLQ